MRRSLRSVYLGEDAKLAQHYTSVLDMLTSNPQYADEAKRDLLGKVRPEARADAEAIVASMKQYAKTPKGAQRDQLATSIVGSLQSLPVREGADRRFRLMTEARRSFSIGFMDDRGGYTGPSLTGMSTVTDQRWPVVNEAEEPPNEALIMAAADVFGEAVTALEELMHEELQPGGRGAPALQNAIRSLQRLSSETVRALRKP